MQDRFKFVLDQIWDCILPCYEGSFDGIVAWLGEEKRVNPPRIKQIEIEEVLNDYHALSLTFNKYKNVTANLGPNIFHVTTSNCLEDIAKSGLKLTLGDKGFSINNLLPREAVFLCKSPSYAACICGKAQNSDNQVVLEIKRDIGLHKVNSMGHDLGLVEKEDDFKYQLGSYEPINSTSIVRLYSNKKIFNEIPEFYKDKFVLVNAKIPNQLKYKSKNTWTRLIAESKN